jgi:hypothetical protein
VAVVCLGPDHRLRRLRQLGRERARPRAGAQDYSLLARAWRVGIADRVELHRWRNACISRRQSLGISIHLYQGAWCRGHVQAQQGDWRTGRAWRDNVTSAGAKDDSGMTIMSPPASCTSISKPALLGGALRATRS